MSNAATLYCACLKSTSESTIFIAQVFTEAAKADLASCNVAFALYRLGCLYSFMSDKRKQDLSAAGLVDRLVSAAAQRCSTFSATELELTLDGLARLHCRCI